VLSIPYLTSVFLMAAFLLLRGFASAIFFCGVTFVAAFFGATLLRAFFACLPLACFFGSAFA
jgi:hypothetical protein